ncbi:hypothetical protein HMSSN036_47560 [Paenibacillus macerans]|nr:hypothetical protein HMSSN036_47560 [Paenibacillus macerans]
MPFAQVISIGASVFPVLWLSFWLSVEVGGCVAAPLAWLHPAAVNATIRIMLKDPNQLFLLCFIDCATPLFVFIYTGTLPFS